MVGGEQDSAGGTLRREVDVDASEGEAGEFPEQESSSTWENVEKGAGRGGVGAVGAWKVCGGRPAAKGDVSGCDVGEEHEATDETGGAL